VTGTILVASPARAVGAAYCRVSSAERRADLERQVGRVAEECGTRGITLAATITEIGSGVFGNRVKLRSCWIGPCEQRGTGVPLRPRPDPPGAGRGACGRTAAGSGTRSTGAWAGESQPRAAGAEKYYGIPAAELMPSLSWLARHVSGVGTGDLRGQVEYKTGWSGVRLHIADTWYPSCNQDLFELRRGENRAAPVLRTHLHVRPVRVHAGSRSERCS
jgi:hypothetical protein